jgi:phospholipid-binding lipoprotein MlaA
VATLLLAGCATTGPSDEQQDPCEPPNRTVFGFNDGLDRYVLEPLGKGWAFITPEFVVTGVDNFFRNLAFPRRFVASLLQGKLVWSASELGRFLVNTSVGVAGFVDVGKHIGLEEHDEDFGQAFGAWGLPSGAYWMIPFVGSANPRDTAGMMFDAVFNIGNLSPVPIFPVRVVNSRAMVVEEVEEARAASLDWYAAVRNAYIAQRRSQVANQELEAPLEEDLYDEASADTLEAGQ